MYDKIQIIIEIEYRPNDAQANDFLTQLNAFIIGNQPPTVYVTTRQENDEPHGMRDLGNKDNHT